MGNVSETTGRRFYIFQFFMCFLMKIVINLHVICMKEMYVIYKQVISRTLKQTLNYGLILNKTHGIIKFNQKAWSKPYIDMNTKLKIDVKNDFEKTS